MHTDTILIHCSRDGLLHIPGIEIIACAVSDGIHPGVSPNLANLQAPRRVVDVRVTVFDGLYHEVDSSEVAFKIAASIAFKEGVETAGGVLLEPIMGVEVVTPEEFMGDVIGDMSARRGRIKRVTPRAGARVISARISLAELFRYATDLLSLSQGQAWERRPDRIQAGGRH